MQYPARIDVKPPSMPRAKRNMTTEQQIAYNQLGQEQLGYDFYNMSDKKFKNAYSGTVDWGKLQTLKNQYNAEQAAMQQQQAQQQAYVEPLVEMPVQQAAVIQAVQNRYIQGLQRKAIYTDERDKYYFDQYGDQKAVRKEVNPYEQGVKSYLKNFDEAGWLTSNQEGDYNTPSGISFGDVNNAKKTKLLSAAAKTGLRENSRRAVAVLAHWMAEIRKGLAFLRTNQQLEKLLIEAFDSFAVQSVSKRGGGLVFWAVPHQGLRKSKWSGNYSTLYKVVSSKVLGQTLQQSSYEGANEFRNTVTGQILDAYNKWFKGLQKLYTLGTTSVEEFVRRSYRKVHTNSKPIQDIGILTELKRKTGFVGAEGLNKVAEASLQQTHKKMQEFSAKVELASLNKYQRLSDLAVRLGEGDLNNPQALKQTKKGLLLARKNEVKTNTDNFFNDKTNITNMSTAITAYTLPVGFSRPYDTPLKDANTRGFFLKHR